MEHEVVAVGECGLDFHYDHSPRDQQAEVFAAQIAMALAHDLTLVIHTREAWPETFDILAAEGVPPRTVFHCFTGGPDEARRCLDLGAVLSFSGIVSFPIATDLHAAAQLCPIDRLLVETDSPYLAPVPHRGKKNQPAWVVDVAAALAAVKGVAVADVADRDMGHGHCHVRPAARLIRQTQRSPNHKRVVCIRVTDLRNVDRMFRRGPSPSRSTPRHLAAGGRRVASHAPAPLRHPPARPRADRAPPAAPPSCGRRSCRPPTAVVDVPLDGDVVEVPALARVHRSRLAFAVGISLAALPVLVLDNLPATAEANEAQVEASSSPPVRAGRRSRRRLFKQAETPPPPTRRPPPHARPHHHRGADHERGRGAGAAGRHRRRAAPHRAAPHGRPPPPRRPAPTPTPTTPSPGTGSPSARAAATGP